LVRPARLRLERASVNPSQRHRKPD
jgi:hypothetical protein